MTTPVYALLAFAVWTYLLLFSTVGWYRWSRILTGRAPISSFKAINPKGADWYLRAMRAHANCVENLPVFAAVVFAIYVAGINTPAINTLAVTVPITRVGQTLVHVTLPESNGSVSLRFAFFFTQVICVLAMAVLLLMELRYHLDRYSSSSRVMLKKKYMARDLNKTGVCSGFRFEKPRTGNPCGAWAVGNYRGIRGYISIARKFFKNGHRGRMSNQGYQQKKIQRPKKP